MSLDFLNLHTSFQKVLLGLILILVPLALVGYYVSVARGQPNSRSRQLRRIRELNLSLLKVAGYRRRSNRKDCAPLSGMDRGCWAVDPQTAHRLAGRCTILLNFESQRGDLR
jgi:hypothetical protein